jgi:hypothetical protein
MLMRTLEDLREAIDSSILSVPLHQHLGISLDRAPAPSREVTVRMKAQPQIVDADGHHSPTAIYLLADVAAGVCICDEIAPRALAMEMGAMFLTTSASFKPTEMAAGPLEATAEVTKGLDETPADRPLKKATLEVIARVRTESGEAAGEQQARFYVRFMEPSRLRELAPEASQVIQILES